MLKIKHYCCKIQLVKRSELPEGATFLSSVWQMKRKRKPSTGEISKYKARMNVDGSQMIKGLHYEETYAPVVQWATIRFFISLAILSNWHTRQLDFVLAFTQADIERERFDADGHPERAQYVVHCPLESWRVYGFIDDTAVRTCRPGSGPIGPDEGPGRPRRNHAYDIQRAFYRNVISIIIDIFNLFVSIKFF